MHAERYFISTVFSQSLRKFLMDFCETCVKYMFMAKIQEKYLETKVPTAASNKNCSMNKHRQIHYQDYVFKKHSKTHAEQ